MPKMHKHDVTFVTHSWFLVNNHGQMYLDYGRLSGRYTAEKWKKILGLLLFKSQDMRLTDAYLNYGRLLGRYTAENWNNTRHDPCSKSQDKDQNYLFMVLYTTVIVFWKDIINNKNNESLEETDFLFNQKM